MIDAIGVRVALLEMVRLSDLGDLGFARAARFNRSTVQRVRDAEDDYIPSYRTLEKWLTASQSVESVGEFLRRFEQSRTYPVLGETDNPPSTQPLGAVDGDSVPKDFKPSQHDRRLLGFIAFAILRAIDHPAAFFEVDDAEADESEERAKGA